MKNVSSVVSGVCATGLDLVPIAKVELWQTPFVASSYGINTGVWKVSTSNKEPWGIVGHVGKFIAYNYPSNVLTDSGIHITNQVWSNYGYNRPYNLDRSEDVVQVYGGYFQMPYSSTGITFKVVGGPNIKLWIGTGANFFPVYMSGLQNALAINHTASLDGRDTSSTTATTGDAYWSGGSWHTFRVNHYITSGSYAKCGVFFKTDDNPTYRLVDASCMSVTGLWLTNTTLSGVASMAGTDEIDKTSTLNFTVATGSQYEYNSTTDSFGILRPNSYLKAYAGYKIGGTNYFVEMGSYFIDSVRWDREEKKDLLRVSCRDARKKLAQAVNLNYPNFLSYDLAGYSSDGVFNSPDGTQRYVAYDSWTLTETVRDLCYKAGLSTKQLWATGTDGNYKMEENNVRLNRGAAYRLKLPNSIKDDLLYSFKPGENLLKLINDLAEQHNYEFGIDYEGDVYLREANNPTRVSSQDTTITYAGFTSGENINSYAGFEYQCTGTSSTISIDPSDNFVGYNLIFNRATGEGNITVDLDGVYTSYSGYGMSWPEVWNYRDGIYAGSGYNPCVLEIGRGVTSGTIGITCSGAVNFAGYETFTEDRESAGISFGTNRVSRLDVENTDDNIRNDVIIAGNKKGIDLKEIIVSRAVDVQSIETPASRNYVGERKPLIFPDPSIIRQDVADALSFGILKRYRSLADIVNYDIPAYPHLELGDPIEITDSNTGLQNQVFWIDRLNWDVSDKAFTMKAGLNPYKPFLSYEPILEPSNPANEVSGFRMSRTDGRSLDPADHSSNTLASYQQATAATATGYYAGRWGEEIPATFVKIEFDLFKSSTVTLEIKDRLTGSTVVLLEQDRYLDWGHYEYLWDGKWFDAEHNNYKHFPVNPDWAEEKGWTDYLKGTDPTTGAKYGNSDTKTGAGYFFCELRYRPINGSGTTSVLATVSGTSTNYAKGILPPEGTCVVNFPAATQPIVTGAGVDVGDSTQSHAYTVFNDNWQAGGGPEGVLFTAEILSEPMKLQITGWMDLHILVTNTNSLGGGGYYYKYNQSFDPESFQNGFHLYQVTDDTTNPWTTNLIAGETDFLSADVYTFLIDPAGMPLKSVDSDQQYYRQIGVGTLGDVQTIIHKKVNPWRNGYFEQISGWFPGKYVNIAWYFNVQVKAINKVGATVDSTRTYQYRLEDPSYSGYKHALLPYGILNTADRGDWANYRHNHIKDNHRKVHFTAGASTNYTYD